MIYPSIMRTLASALQYDVSLTKFPVLEMCLWDKVYTFTRCCIIDKTSSSRTWLFLDKASISLTWHLLDKIFSSAKCRCPGQHFQICNLLSRHDSTREQCEHQRVSLYLWGLGSKALRSEAKGRELRHRRQAGEVHVRVLDMSVTGARGCFCGSGDQRGRFVAGWRDKVKLRLQQRGKSIPGHGK